MKDLLSSRKFIGLIIGLVMIVVLAFYPGFPDIESAVTDMSVVVTAYILGTAIDPRTDWQNKLLGIFRSRKFWAAIAGLAFILVKQFVPDLPFTEEQVTAAIITLSTFIIGTGIQDKLVAGMSTVDKARANSK